MPDMWGARRERTRLGGDRYYHLITGWSGEGVAIQGLPAFVFRTHVSWRAEELFHQTNGGERAGAMMRGRTDALSCR
jgi:hypothetical protein